VRHERGELTKTAIQILDRGLDDDQKFRDAMRSLHPGISDWVLREAKADARLIIAYRKFQSRETE
jgi:hypothetical protein